MSEPIRYSPSTSAEQVRIPPSALTPGAWESVPKFIRFAVWLYAIATVVGVAVTVGGALLLMLAASV